MAVLVELQLCCLRFRLSPWVGSCLAVSMDSVLGYDVMRRSERAAKQSNAHNAVRAVVDPLVLLKSRDILPKIPCVTRNSAACLFRPMFSQLLES